MKKLINQDKKENNFIISLKASISGRKFRSGAYVSFLSVIVIVIVLVINLFVSKLDVKIDFSSQNLYTLSQETKSMLKNLTGDITIYYMVEAGKEYPEFQEIAAKYDSLSDQVKLEEKDPILYPKFAASLGIEDEVSQNSFIVVNNETDRAKYIDSNEMIVQEMDSNYQFNTTGIDVEGKLTNAIQYVINPDLPVMYLVEGHGEVEVGDVFNDLMERQNVKTETISTLSQSTIPKDCDMLFINAPSADLSEDEVNMIKDYMSLGGNVIITLNYKSNDLKNLNAFLDYYGIKVEKGFVVEGNSNQYLPNNPHYLLPEIISHDITERVKANKVFVIAPIASGLTTSENLRSSLMVEPLLSTSEEAYSKVDIYTQTLSKAEGDIDGPFNIGMISSDTYNNVTSNLVVYSSDMIFGEDVISNYGNGDILTGTARYLSGENATLAIATKSIVPEYINLSQKQSSFWGAITVLIIPVFILGTGIYVSLRRRKR